MLNASTVIADTIMLVSGNNTTNGNNGANGINGTNGQGGTQCVIPPYYICTPLDNGGTGGTGGTSGVGGDAGSAGNTSFIADHLRTKNITLVRETGDFNFDIGTMYVKANDTMFLKNINSGYFNIDVLLFDLTGVASGSTMLSINGSSSSVNLLNTDITLAVDKSNPLLEAGYSIDLINVVSNASSFSIFGNTSLHGTTLQARQGVSIIYDFEVNQTNKTLTATTIDGARLNPKTKTLGEGFVGGFVTVKEGQDLIADMSINNIAYIAQTASDIAPFVIGSKGSSKYDTGSFVDVDSIHLIAGLAFNTDLDDLYGQSLTTGAFFEAGESSYETDNELDTAASVKSRGDVKYYGLGALARFAFSPSEIGRLYFDAAIRGGRAKNSFISDDLTDNFGVKAEYDIKGLYYGAHAGVGYIFNLTDNSHLELYGKYLYLHQDGDSYTLSTSDEVKFGDINSQRVKGGFNLFYTINEYFTPYIGVAYEHEFDGKSKGSIYGFELESPDLKGESYIGELDLAITPSRDSSFFIDLNVKGYIGKREGISGSLKMEYGF
jgi:hypothetical protein